MLPAERGVVIIPRLVGESKFSPSSNFNALSWQSKERAGKGQGKKGRAGLPTVYNFLARFRCVLCRQHQVLIKNQLKLSTFGKQPSSCCRFSLPSPPLQSLHLKDFLPTQEVGKNCRNHCLKLISIINYKLCCAKRVQSDSSPK